MNALSPRLLMFHELNVSNLSVKIKKKMSKLEISSSFTLAVKAMKCFGLNFLQEITLICILITITIKSPKRELYVHISFTSSLWLMFLAFWVYQFKKYFTLYSYLSYFYCTFKSIYNLFHCTKKVLLNAENDVNQ